MKTLSALLLLLPLGAAGGEILHYADLNTREIAALDAASTVVILPGGILEQHGPYLPSGTDALTSRHLADALARDIIENTDRNVLMLPVVYLGVDGANVIGARWSFPGSLNVRAETLRQVFMDYGDALGEAGFRNIFVVHLHGAPSHNLALDQAAAYFRDTWDGMMVNLTGIDTVMNATRAARRVMSEEAIAAQGFSVHGAAQEHAMVLYLRPDLVAADYRKAPAWRANDLREMVELAHDAQWPGYFGAPAYANRAMGEAIVKTMEEQMAGIALAILDGADPADYPRVSAQRQAQRESSHAKRQRERQQAWLKKNVAR